MEVTTEQLLQMIGAKQVAIELNLQPKLARAAADLAAALRAPCPREHCVCGDQPEPDPALD